MNLSGTVKIVEVGPRDGLQNEKTALTLKDKVSFIEALSKAGLSVIEAGAFVSPKWIPQMAESAAVYSTLRQQEGVSYPILVPNEKGMEKALEAGVKEIAVFTASSETFCLKNINCSIEESFNRFQPVMNLAQRYGIKVRGYVSCSLGCPYEGEIPYRQTARIAQRLIDEGCYEISIGDTIGVGTPRKVQQLLSLILKTVAVDKIAVHFHDTYGQAIANILQALQLGVRIIDSSVAGLGGCPYAQGATGNVATEDALYLLEGMGIETGVNLKKIATIGCLISQKLNRENGSKVGRAMYLKGELEEYLSLLKI